MTDLTKLKELAERAVSARPIWYAENGNDWFLERDCAIWLAAANPQAILGLIAQLEGLDRLIQGRWRPEVERLEEENAALKDKLSDCAISLHGEMMQKYGGQSPEDMHPVTRRDYERDIAEIAEYTAALEGGGK
ncbi:hypothetical protein [Pseudomonas nitroreducens]|uniref:hypothetical protein n=1 Tax=Pseudomonas nitroreducens TaxID=46680 RepID=UPI003D28FFD6